MECTNLIPMCAKYNFINLCYFGFSTAKINYHARLLTVLSLFLILVSLNAVALILLLHHRRKVAES